MKKSFRILLTLVLAVVMVLSLTACLSDCEAGKHAFVDVAAKPATCTTAGNIAYKKCPVCGLCVDADGKQIAEADITIAAIGHVFDKEVATPDYLQTEATCGNPATYYKSCVCGEKGTETFTVGEANSHVYNQEVVHADYLASEATCTAKATYYKSCACGAKGAETFEHGDLAAHTVGSWDDGKAATCKNTGELGHYTCSVCQQYIADDKTTVIADLTIEKNPSEHMNTSSKAAQPASCIAEGKKAHTVCNDCGAFIVDGKNVAEAELVISKLDHTYGTWNEGTPATCVAEGTKAHQYCSTCKKNYDKNGVEIADITIAKDTTNGHKTATDWTVGEDDKHYHVCENGCGAHLDEAAHVYNQEVVHADYLASEATCTAKATYFKSCVCGKKGNDTFESDSYGEHSRGANQWHEAKPATCESRGTVGYYRCANCNQNIAEDNITIIENIYTQLDPNNHSNLTDVNEVPASCTKTGTKEHQYCTGCKKCVVDGKNVAEAELVISKLDHTYGDWNDEVPATCTTAGTKGYQHCSVCEKNYDVDDVEIADLTIAIDSNAHDYKYADTSSTKHTVTCGREGCTYTAQLVEHSYATDTHKCLCGKTEPKVGWHVVYDINDLKVGDKIIIVGSKDSTYYAIGTNQKDNNRAAAALTTEGTTIIVGDDVQVIVLEVGNKEGTFAFNVGTGYLYAASSNSNRMKTEITLSDNSSWTISIKATSGVATIKAQGSNSKNWLRYNSTSDLFSCYSSEQQDVYIYKYYPACDHVGKETETTTVEATCTADGATTVTCKYCGEAISTTVIKGGHVYGTPVVDASDSTKHTYTCTREDCDDYYSEAHAYENHACTKCNAAEPSCKITVTNTAIDGNSATVVVKVGDDVISAGDDGKYSIYQNSNVAITITAPEGYMLDVVKMGSTELESFNGTHSFTITADVTFEVTIKVIPAAHTCDFKTPAKLDSADDKYASYHKMVCECGKVSETLVDHNWTPEQIDGDETQHKLVCVCGYEGKAAHDFDPNTHKCVGCGLSRLKTISQALDACGKLENKAYSNDIWYVQGYVVGTPEYSSQYSNYTLNIATELGGETVLKVYGLKLNDKSTGIYENDLIVVSGYLQNYNSTLEITFNNTSTETQKDCLLATYTAGASTISVSSESSANATVTIADGKTSGKNGTNFTFTVVADSGYEVTSVKVNDNVVAAGEDGKYTAKVEGATTILVATKEEGAVVTKTYTYTFTKKVFEGNESQALGVISWTLSGSGNYFGYDETKGQQFGASSNPSTNMTLTSNTSFSKITKITINTSGAKDINALFIVTVGGTQIGSKTVLKTTAIAYTFEPTAAVDGIVAFNFTQTSSKAIYIKSITIEYSE